MSVANLNGIAGVAGEQIFYVYFTTVANVVQTRKFAPPAIGISEPPFIQHYFYG